MNIKSKSHLVRALSLTALIIYGVGDILGAGIYAIIGKIAGHAGSFTWLSFMIAMCVVLLTALSYAELGSRYPKSGGVSVYIQEAFGCKWLSILSGVLLFSATIFSMATLSQAFAGYLNSFGIKFPKWAAVCFFFITLFLINIRGIKQSSVANMVSTAIEISGLFIVLLCGFLYLSKTPSDVSVNSMPLMSEIFRGAALAFFAFTGFEDLANVAEEVKNPEKNLPRAILFALGIAGMMYLSVSWVATAVVPGAELSQFEAPLLAVVDKSYPAMPSYLFSLIAIFAVFNTTLLNYITASRLLYGMSRMNLLPKAFQKVHQQYHTPYVAILVIFPIVVILGLAGTLKSLASSTSTIVLVVFSLSSVALIKVKFSKKNSSSTIFQIPIFIPFVAIALNVLAILFLPLDTVVFAGIFILGGIALSWLILRLEK